ncbi:phosphatase PAP2 family protein [bacterium]|nr:MAG: phosphatase PAP2 family protein [bacterium]
MFHFLIQVDQSVFLFFNNTLSNSIFDKIFPIITEPKNWLIVTLIAMIFFIFKEKKKAIGVIALVLVAAVLSDLIAYRIIKPLFGRLRPCHPEYFIQGGRFLVGMKTSFSFPSNHAMNMFTAATVLSYFYQKYSGYFLGFAALIGFSRIYVGVHYPLDIIGGAVFGIILGSGVYRGYVGIKVCIKRKVIPKENNEDHAEADS